MSTKVFGSLSHQIVSSATLYPIFFVKWWEVLIFFFFFTDGQTHVKEGSQRFLANVKGKIIPLAGRFYKQLHNLKRITNSGKYFTGLNFSNFNSDLASAVLFRYGLYWALYWETSFFTQCLQNQRVKQFVTFVFNWQFN